ncbi:hypothetical protein D3C71_611970 [compost metagenome]
MTTTAPPLMEVPEAVLKMASTPAMVVPAESAYRWALTTEVMPMRLAPVRLTVEFSATHTPMPTRGPVTTKLRRLALPPRCATRPVPAVPVVAVKFAVMPSSTWVLLPLSTVTPMELAPLKVSESGLLISSCPPPYR